MLRCLIAVERRAEEHHSLLVDEGAGELFLAVVSKFVKNKIHNIVLNLDKRSDFPAVASPLLFRLFVFYPSGNDHDLYHAFWYTLVGFPFMHKPDELATLAFVD